MHILITGARGRLGSRLLHTLAAAHHVSGYDLPELDISDWAALRAAVRAAAPQVVINAAAWTDVDGCARDPQKALLMNGYAAQNVALAAAEVGAAVVQVSTNEVFDGQGRHPCDEYAPCAPINPYGYSKWAGEQGVRQVNPRHYIVRTAWLFAHGGRNFIQAILGAARAGKPLRVVIDEVANPTFNDDLAAAIADLIETGRYGTYHLVNEGAASRYAFARYTLELAGLGAVPLEPISLAQWPRPSTPPRYAPLLNTAAAQMGIRLRPWQAAVADFLRQAGEMPATG
ncbi:MAG: dTDP-4-dehydrorhamnose reductase [Anaerolineae bacterium]|nr:dTDP-4-dehydrorhamnose reductase [Anaerolineae bacterium]